jgi:flagellar basal-body rod protein FlgG
MIRALYSAASGMTAQQLNVDNIANNLANANTTGYKMRTPQFQDLLYQNIIAPGVNAGQQTTVPSGLQLGLGTRAASNEIIFTQGSLNATDRSRWIRTAWWWIPAATRSIRKSLFRPMRSR